MVKLIFVRHGKDNHELAALLSDCSEYEKKILLDVASATKKSLRENRSQFHSLR